MLPICLFLYFNLSTEKEKNQLSKSFLSIGGPIGKAILMVFLFHLPAAGFDKVLGPLVMPSLDKYQLN